jgi:hypothetical protein
MRGLEEIQAYNEGTIKLKTRVIEKDKGILEREKIVAYS